jgi:hypothetical protein
MAFLVIFLELQEPYLTIASFRKGFAIGHTCGTFLQDSKPPLLVPSNPAGQN